jgi:hypothetical protein
MVGKVVPFGYAGKDAEERISALMEDEKAILVDIRFKPYSRWRPIWGFHALINRWGLTRYQWEGNVLGNKNYNNERLQRDENLILLCACSKYETCHRKTVVELLKHAMPEVEVVQ